MKKIFKLLSVSMLSFMMAVLFVIPVNAEEDTRTLEEGYYPKNSEVYRNASPAMKSMFDLQNEITEHLGKKDGKYVYDYETIKNIVYSYDFTEVNKELDQTWTKETFLGTVILNIDSTSIESRTKRAYVTGPLCRVNKTDSIWNSTREYRDYSRTNDHASELMSIGLQIQGNSHNLTVQGFNLMIAPLAVISPYIVGLAKLAKIGYSGIGWWMRQVSSSLTNSNKKSYCGTVLDINMVRVFSSWNQVDN